MAKRGVVVPDVYKQRKRLCSSKNSDGDNVKTAFGALRALFPVDSFHNRLPPIVHKHQLYSLIINKTEVDKELDKLKDCGYVRLFHLGPEKENVCAVLMEDYIRHLRRLNHGDSGIIEKFITGCLKRTVEMSIGKDMLLKDLSKEEEITDLMQIGVLTVKEVGSWWFAIPNAGEFVKCYLQGRKAVEKLIRKSKYKEIFQRELEQRKLPKAAKLGMMYHIHDIVGSETVEIVQTSSGKLLRLKD